MECSAGHLELLIICDRFGWEFLNDTHTLLDLQLLATFGNVTESCFALDTIVY